MSHVNSHCGKWSGTMPRCFGTGIRSTPLEQFPVSNRIEEEARFKRVIHSDPMSAGRGGGKGGGL